MNYRKMACGKLVMAVGVEWSLADIINKLEVCDSCEKTISDKKCTMRDNLAFEYSAEEKRINLLRGAK